MILGREPREILGYTGNYGMDTIAVFLYKRNGRHCLRLVNHYILLLLLSYLCYYRLCFIPFCQSVIKLIDIVNILVDINET